MDLCLIATEQIIKYSSKTHNTYMHIEILLRQKQRDFAPNLPDISYLNCGGLILYIQYIYYIKFSIKHSTTNILFFC